MTNAKDELIKHIAGREVEYVSIRHGSYVLDDIKPIKGTLEEVLPLLDFEYNAWCGSQHLDGCIWFADGTWSERVEYDGSEWWEHRERPRKEDYFE